ALEMELPAAPIGNALGLARDEAAHRAAGDLPVEIVVLGHDVAGLIGIGVHELDRLSASADHRTNEIAPARGGSACRHADDVVERRQDFACCGDTAVFRLDLRPYRLGHWRHVDVADIERGNALAEAAGFDEFRVLRLV